MADYERYGDYNEIDEPPAKRGFISLFLKILVAMLCIGVVGIIAFRIILFNYYPASMKTIYFNDTLTEYYNATRGDVGAKTQTILSKYDDPDKGNFFSDYLIIVPGINQLQITVRCNSSVNEAIAEKYGLESFDVSNDGALTFRLYDNEGRVYDNLVHVERDELMMYRYFKLVFEDVLFYGENGTAEEIGAEGNDDPKWIRLEIFVNGQQGEPFSKLPIYENHETYSEFKSYELSASEVPG